MAMFRRILSLLMAFVLVLGMIPVGVRAEETEAAEIPAETTAPAEETTAPTETESTEDTTAPTEAETEATEETVVVETVENASQEAAYAIVDSGTCGDNLTWELDSEGTLTISGTGEMDDYEAYVDDAPWQNLCMEITEVVIQQGVTSIGAGAFYYCTNLTSATIPNSVTSIGESAFTLCENLRNITIPNSVTSIGDRAFSSCGLTNIVIPEGVTSIGSFSFGSCEGLSSVTIPASVTNIGDAPFQLCYNLVKIQVQSGNSHYVSDASGVLYNKSKTILIQAPGMLSGSYSIPDSVTSIGVAAFSGCSFIETVELPDKLASIGGTAFHGCINLTGITIPKNVSSIGEFVWGGCTHMTGIQVESGNAQYASDAFGVLYDKNKTTLIQAPGKIAENYAIPDSVTTIEDYAFFACIHFENITVPSNITRIGNYAFCYCYKMTDIYFEGNAPEFGDGVFLDDAITAHYPANNPTWTEEVMQNYGGRSVTWVSDGPVHHNTLNELNEVDYLAFAQIAYEDFKVGQSVAQCLSGKWNDVWGEDGIKYAELCECIANWTVCYIPDKHSEGFYAVAFTNNAGEAVLAYRGSKPANMFTDDDAFEDWVVNDLPMIIFNASLPGNQFDQAIDAYNETAALPGIHTVNVTGHSLGGLWGNIASGYSGCEGVTFNSISALDIMYATHPEELGENFLGVDVWNFTDHVNQYDIAAGMTEAIASYLIFGTKLKPYVKYKSNYGMFNVVNSHSLNSLVSRNGDELKMNGKTGEWKGSNGISNRMSNIYDWAIINLAPNRAVDMGVSKRDVFNKGLALDEYRTSYGGNGKDEVTGGILGDTLIGGRDDDDLDGRFGSDTYIYYKGDGLDTIHDSGGQDKLILKNFDDDDILQIMEDIDEDYIYINCNGDDIVQIYKHNREYRAINLNSFKVYIDGVENDISWNFNKYHSGNSLLIHCPVDVEVLDAGGNVVYIVEDGAVGNYYTEFGNFYVFEEEDGGYGKTLDLAEGYTTRIVGLDAGTMDIEYREGVNGQLAEPKNFVDVPITPEFTATFEETDDGELVLAADTDGDDVVDVKLGYDGKPVPVESIVLAQEYLALKPGQSAQLLAEVRPAELTEFVTWSAEQEEEIIAVDDSGEVTGLNVGTAYVIATIHDGETERTARCRVDVAETEVVEEVEKIKLDGIRLGAAKLTTELFSTDYAEFDILLKLPQNYPEAMTASRNAAMAQAEVKDRGVAIEAARFTDDAMAELFELRVLDDRRVQIVPRAETAIANPKTVKGKYSSSVTVTVQGKAWTSEEVLTLTVKKTLPKLKASVETFNSFYSRQTHRIAVTGGTVTGIRENTAKATPLPEWLKLSGEELILQGAPPRSMTGKVYLLVDTEEWAVPAEVTLSVKNSYKAPGLKLSASGITVTALAENSDGVELKLHPKSKKETLADLGVKAVQVSGEFPNYEITEALDVTDGTFTLKPLEGFEAGKIGLEVEIEGAAQPLVLPLTVRTKALSLKLSSGTVTLNTAAKDSTAVTVTTDPADYDLSDLAVLDCPEDLAAKVIGNRITLRIGENAEADKTHKLTITAGGSETTLTVKTIEKTPSVTLKAKGNLDLSFPERAVIVTPGFKNYSGGFEVTETAAEGFQIERTEKILAVTCDGDVAPGTYTLTLKLKLDDGKIYPASVKVTVKRTAVKLKLSASRLTLNKAVNDAAGVAVSCTTKDYAFSGPEQELLELKNKAGQDAAEELTVTCEKGRLTVSVNEKTKFGETYKVLVRAEENAPAVTLTVSIPAENKSTVTSSLKAGGSIDVIRDGSAVTVTPSYRNCTAHAQREEWLEVLDAEQNVIADSREENPVLKIQKDAQGRYVIAKVPGADLDHTGKYTARLIAIFAGDETVSSTVKLSVKMGSAKVTPEVSGTLFAKDKNSRVRFSFRSADAALNGVEKVTVKDAKYQDKLEVLEYENGEFALCFKGGKVEESLIGRTVTVTLNLYLDGNETEKANTTAKLKLTVQK